MKKILIIFILILTLITTCRLIHFFDDTNSITQTTTTTTINSLNRPVIVLKGETGEIIHSNTIKDLGLIPFSPLGNSRVINLKIRNNGGKNLIIESINIKDTSNCSVTYTLPKTELNPSEEVPFTININFSGLGDTFFRLEINSNDPYKSIFSLSFKGRVVNAMYVSVQTGSDTTGDGTQTKPYQSINKALQTISIGGLICVAAGDYGESINMDGMHFASLYGGYYCDGTNVNWNDRNVSGIDPKYITKITPLSSGGFTISISGNNTPLEIEGFTINSYNNSSALPLRNIQILNSQNITLKNNIINLGESSMNISGIYINESDNINIIHNTIQGGKLTGDSSLKGIDAEDSTINIFDNLIDVGNFNNSSPSSSTYYGIYGGNCILNIQSNNITNTRDTNVTNRYGIYAFNCQHIIIRNNFNIKIRTSTANTTGIYLNNGDVTGDTTIENNTIRVENNTTGSGGKFRGIENTLNITCNTSIMNNTIILANNNLNSDLIGLSIMKSNSNTANIDVKVYNNVIYAGISNIKVEGISIDSESSLSDFKIHLLNNTVVLNGKNNVKGISLSENIKTYIENNILFLNKTGGSPTDPTADEYGIYENAITSDPETIRNNCVFGFNYLYYDYDETSDSDKKIKNLIDFNKSAKTNQKEATSVANNVSMNPNFVNLLDPQSGLKLNPNSPEEVKRGGKDLSSLFTKDRDYGPRTIPWSIGAYECDP